MNDKVLQGYGVADARYKNSNEAYKNTYTTEFGALVPTPLIFPDNPHNDLVLKSKNVLDFGCGIGRNLLWIMNDTEAHYWGIDTSPEMRQYFWDIQHPRYQPRVTLLPNFEGMGDVKLDVVVVTFVFQHIGYRPEPPAMNITDITQEINKYCHDDTVWILYEHDWEEPWIERWMMENGIVFDFYKRDYTGIEELTHRSPHHMMIFKGKVDE